jgi:ZIP family zinc transporter
MAEAALWGAVGASALVVGAEIAFAFRLSKLVIGLIMAFGVGALIASVSFELIAPAIQSAETWQVAIGLGLGSAVFFFGDRLIANLGGSGRKNSEGGGDEGGGGLGIVLGTVLDGVPESAVLGMSLVGGGGVSVALLARHLGFQLSGVARIDGQHAQFGMGEEQNPAALVGCPWSVSGGRGSRIRHR